MDFYLVRHGEAVAATVDPQRPLSAPGRRAVEAVARAAAGRDVRVGAILHSGILRARQTAEIFTQILAPAQGASFNAGLLPEDDPAVAKAELEAASDSVMLVGHLPHMSRLAALLARGLWEWETVDFAPATLVCCSYDGARWRMHWKIDPELC